MQSCLLACLPTGVGSVRGRFDCRVSRAERRTVVVVDDDDDDDDDADRGPTIVATTVGL